MDGDGAKGAILGQVRWGTAGVGLEEVGWGQAASVGLEEKRCWGWVGSLRG